MFTRLSPKFRQVIPLIILIFSFNFVLTTPALGYELPLDLDLAGSRPAVTLAQHEVKIQTFVLLAESNRVQLAQLQGFIQTNGGRTIHIFPYQALIAEILSDTIAPLTQFAGVAGVYTQTVELATMDNYGPSARNFASAWNNLIAPQAIGQDMHRMAGEHPENHNDAFIAPDIPSTGGPTVVANSSVTPGYYQTSEFMAGSVTVGIVLVESNGTVDPSTENWTTDEKQLVFNEIMTGLDWWARLEPRAHLSFVYDDHFSNPLPTGVEPITRPYYQQQYWIGDAMSALGYNSSSYFTSVRDYNNVLRDSYQTDWAFTIFVVDSSADSDNRFKDGYFAYAYLGGPFMVMTYGNNGYGPGNMDAIAAHEMGHIFYALDQYASAYQSCALRSGYLYVENRNSQYGNCSMNMNSIMRGQIYPYSVNAIDPYAAGQIGWRDSDGDNIFDPLDVELPITLTDFLVTGNSVTLKGLAEVIPYPSPNYTSVTINTLASVQYRFNEDGWQQAIADDGIFNGTSESYHFTSSPLWPGLYMLEVAAFDMAGNKSNIAATKTVLIPDLSEPGPDTELYVPSSTITNQTINVNGVAYQTQSGQLAQVEYRVNGQTWQFATAQDGAFDSNYEPFSLFFNFSEPGMYLLEAFATDVEGNIEANFARHEIHVTTPSASTIFLPIVIGGK